MILTDAQIKETIEKGTIKLILLTLIVYNRPHMTSGSGKKD